MGAWDRRGSPAGKTRLSRVRCHIYLADKSILGRRIWAYHLRVRGACCMPISVRVIINATVQPRCRNRACTRAIRSEQAQQVSRRPRGYLAKEAAISWNYRFWRGRPCSRSLAQVILWKLI